eukprot:GHVQ01027217.1.p1 GENE.GHVQ01027217.1~~GHVQ01027217.1.p1  ORF type:complete len:219 (+),score=20.28 GHVQ01027217.1:687-1343(+)
MVEYEVLLNELFNRTKDGVKYTGLYGVVTTIRETCLPHLYAFGWPLRSSLACAAHLFCKAPILPSFSSEFFTRVCESMRDACRVSVEEHNNPFLHMSQDRRSEILSRIGDYCMRQWKIEVKCDVLELDVHKRLPKQTTASYNAILSTLVTESVCGPERLSYMCSLAFELTESYLDKHVRDEQKDVTKGALKRIAELALRNGEQFLQMVCYMTITSSHT